MCSPPSRIFTTNRFESPLRASRFWSDIRSSRATLTNLLGSMVNILWSAAPSPDDADNRLRMCMSAPIPTFGTDFEKRFNLRFIQSYSLTDFGSGQPTFADEAARSRLQARDGDWLLIRPDGYIHARPSRPSIQEQEHAYLLAIGQAEHIEES